MSERIYMTALGIQTGDLVRTSYGTDPYEVYSIQGPRYLDQFPGALIIRTWPVIDLRLLYIPDKDGSHAYINSVRREGERYFTDNDKEGSDDKIED